MDKPNPLQSIVFWLFLVVLGVLAGIVGAIFITQVLAHHGMRCSEKQLMTCYFLIGPLFGVLTVTGLAGLTLKSHAPSGRHESEGLAIDRKESAHE